MCIYIYYYIYNIIFLLIYYWIGTVTTDTLLDETKEIARVIDKVFEIEAGNTKG